MPLEILRQYVTPPQPPLPTCLPTCPLGCPFNCLLHRERIEEMPALLTSRASGSSGAGRRLVNLHG
ncbi:hypothetical protein [Streptomyces sp. NPDC046925]|uniref:hypothetical protein n=1 Tax=Streptomyces sp. NPDC046925 TaxID=3155375 RepID=UPI0033D4F375